MRRLQRFSALDTRHCGAVFLLAAASMMLSTSGCGSDASTSLRQHLDALEGPGLLVSAGDVVVGVDGVEADVAESDVAPSDVVAPEELPGGALCDADAQCQSRRCWWRDDGQRCAEPCRSGACPDGLRCVAGEAGGDGYCADPWVAQCAPCGDDSDCQADGGAAPVLAESARCVALSPAGGSVCAVACVEATDGRTCPEGASCSGGFCLPDQDAPCLCSPFAVGSAATSACKHPNETGVCAGSRTCATIGAEATACDAPIATAEECNGRDDDCDGQIDDPPYLTSCAPYLCGGLAGCLTSCAEGGVCAPGYACDGQTGVCAPDGGLGSVCGEANECDSDYCTNNHCCTAPDPDERDVLCCAEDADCGALDLPPSCTRATATGCGGTRGVGRCVAAVCKVEMVSDPEACEGQSCDEPSCAEGGTLRSAATCQSDGSCGGATTSPCRDGNPCTSDACTGEACVFTPRDGPTQTACYGFAAITRGQGTCRDGALSCNHGVLGACVGAIGPARELCNGLDDDCDGFTDQGVEAECYPYLCAGAAGCATTCENAADCGAGTFCDASRSCVPTGDNGSTCNTNAECQSGHCDAGLCCESGSCCNDQLDCADLSLRTCEDRTREGCVGYLTRSSCGDAFQCVSELGPSPAACTGLACGDEPACLVDGTLGKDWTCADDGSCQPGTRQDCSPYRCRGQACPTGCQGDEDCMLGSGCRNGQCKPLADGSSCSESAQCLSGRCSQGVCCSGDLCCKLDSQCAALNGAAVCSDVSGCVGRVDRGFCRADFVCETRVVPAPEACQGRSCAAASCVNITGPAVILEGVNRPVCSAAGQCQDAVRDCGQFQGGAFCDQANKFVYRNCDNCGDDRFTCVAPVRNCRCE